jgi:type IV pilus assembly protein PilY1
MGVKRILPIFLMVCLPTSALALTLSQTPLFIASTEPRIMLVASRDHQLSVKAYTDYSDIDSNGILDITYNDGINYYGYFDFNKCYAYSTTNNRFDPSVVVTSGTHQCNGSTWSGNFMNWATMTRMDVLRKTFYGGHRSTDTASTSSASGETVLERHFLPMDVHAFVKVFNPNNNATLKLYIPSSVINSTTTTAISLCNVTDTTGTTLTGNMGFPLPAPLIKVAAGPFPQWDSSEVDQCQLAGAVGNNSANITNQPIVLLGAFNARVKVCDSTVGVESNCKAYIHPTALVQTSKPVGLLQQYGDVDASRRVRFGLMTGSYAGNKSGGVLRKNVGLIANNNNTSIASSSVCGDNNNDDEIDVCTGQFINQDSTQAGIINTLNRLRIAGFQYTSQGMNGLHQYSCNSPGILSFADGQCVDWGNPLAETYFETLRYFANVGPTSAFDVNDATILASIPRVNWTDPIPATQWCAISNIIVLSTGLNSFDTDQLASFTPTGGTSIDANSLTHTVGDASHENINGGSYLVGNLIGGNGPNANNQCTAKTGVDLDKVKGICPELPYPEGGYGIAGLAYAPKTIDLRPAYATQRDARWGGNKDPINPDWALRQPLDTYTVQLGESLPSFTVSVGSGSVTLLPACQAIQVANAPAWTTSSTGWRNCSLTNLIIDENVGTALVGTDPFAKTKTCSGNGTTSRCFTVSWENSSWGNDYDMDAIQRLGYCVGSACSTFKMVCPTSSSGNATFGSGSSSWPTSVGSSQIVIATCALSAGIGSTMTLGYTLSGTTNDGASFPILQNNAFYAVGAVSSNATPPNAARFDGGSFTAQLLKNPLWYAAKYGGFVDSTPTAGTPAPDLLSEWDQKNNLTGLSGADGDPDNYFNVRNPSNLSTALSNVFDRATQRSGDAASAATNSTNLKVESRIYQAKFSSVDWSGQLLSFRISASGTLNPVAEWDSGSIINTQTSRVILTQGATDGVAFSYIKLTSAQQASLNKNAPGSVTDNCGDERVAYLRGSVTNEGAATDKFTCSSNSQITKFRQRKTSKLGDIINSNPMYVGSPSAGFSDVEQPGYSAFRKSKLNRKPVVYAGGNDGMLHGFDASLTFSTSHPEGVPTATAGQEVLAYVPSVVFPNLSKLADQSYNKNHLYFVDGSPMSGDADLDSSASNNWRTVLVSGMGAGGKGYFALDISDPASYSETGSAPADSLLWEFNETDMGYAFNLPPVNGVTNQAKQIVKMANGKWAVIVGNGYNSVAGKAVLYIILIESGIDGTWIAGDYVKIQVDAPAAPATTSNNGLSTPVPYDSNGDGFADTVYAGDLKGKLWKFLVGPNTSDASVTGVTSTWKIAFSSAGCASATTNACTPLFTATDSAGTAQPILSPPEVAAHPNGGQMILFGTGKYVEPSDINSTASQTFYGIWDRHDGTTTVGTRATELIQQTLTANPSGLSADFRVLSANPIKWRSATGVNPAANCTPVAACNPTHMGWYFDLPTSKERATGVPKLLNKVIFFNTLIPSDAPCDAGGTGYLMPVDYLSGGQVNRPIFDTNFNGSINSSDTAVAGFQVGAAIGGTTLIQNKSSSSNVGVGVTAGTLGNLETTIIDFGIGARGRLSWREIVQ